MPQPDIQIDVYFYTQASGSTVPVISDLPSGYSLSLYYSVVGNSTALGPAAFNKVTNDSAYPNGHYQVVVPSGTLPSGSSALGTIYGAGSQYANNNGIIISIGQANVGSAIPFAQAFAITMGAGETGITGTALTTGGVGQDNGTSPTPATIQADAFNFPPKPAPTPVQWIHDTVWNWIGTV